MSTVKRHINDKCQMSNLYSIYDPDLDPRTPLSKHILNSCVIHWVLNIIKSSCQIIYLCCVMKENILVTLMSMEARPTQIESRAIKSNLIQYLFCAIQEHSLVGSPLRKCESSFKLGQRYSRADKGPEKYIIRADKGPERYTFYQG